MDANYPLKTRTLRDKKANLADVVKRHCCHLSTKRREAILNLLEQCEDLFDGTLFHTKPVHLELKKDAVPKHHEAFPVAKIHEVTLKKELDWLRKLGVLKNNSDSTWAAPTFIIPKKNGTVWFISDFRYLNKCLVRKPYPIPKIADVLLNQVLIPHSPCMTLAVDILVAPQDVLP